ncbi:MAG: tRNA uridine-5-carboxymethylaminomethyl(34) synthesis GTPase MnmE [Gammaproteobacteria bacterium]|jgi:tRNA modification GTPase|nr:tRNA uridine-5-carboxymethylaminomethyl(34) synthesis GTPase MnmE [Gammaproteobacteria bacterium]
MPNVSGQSTDTICAIATPSGIGGVGIVRVSGPLVEAIVVSIIGEIPPARYAHYSTFINANKEILDKGISLFFPSPNSFTGEDVLEFQAHGGPIILDQLMQTILACGARIARPGEFSERAFLNNKIDLTQAEAIADLIESHSVLAARHALRSLQGEFSSLINALLSSIIELRVFVEAAIDFPEEEIDFLASSDVKDKLVILLQELDKILAQAKTGSILKEGLSIVIVGEPNVGKSSLLNILSGNDSAIVTNIPGTTRDTLKELIDLDGLPAHFIDTAGLRKSADIVEQEGMRRTWDAVKKADHILLLVDSNKDTALNNHPMLQELIKESPDLDKITIVKNKIDLNSQKAGINFNDEIKVHCVSVSVLKNIGIENLISHLKHVSGFTINEEGGFIARRRHVDALNRAKLSVEKAQEQLLKYKAGELLADDLRQAQLALSEITGEFSSDDLLGEIFSSFCIGK